MLREVGLRSRRKEAERGSVREEGGRRWWWREDRVRAGSSVREDAIFLFYSKQRRTLVVVLIMDFDFDFVWRVFSSPPSIKDCSFDVEFELN